MQPKPQTDRYLYLDFCDVPKDEMRRRISQTLLFIATQMKSVLEEDETKLINQAAENIMKKSPSTSDYHLNKRRR